jgi:putative membrane protein
MPATVVPGWLGLAAIVVAQICYPLTSDGARAAVVVGTVVAGFLLSFWHAASTRGIRVALALISIFLGGGFLAEALGLRFGIPFGEYAYGAGLGSTVAGVPVVVALAWAWMAWPAWLAAGHLLGPAAGGPLRILVAGVALASWDLFLDPQMVAEGYWHWTAPTPGLPGVATVPISNYVGWLAVALILMAALARLAGPAAGRLDRRGDAPMLALYLWTYFSALLAHAVLLNLPASAWWGGLGMGVVALPLSARLLCRSRVSRPAG